MTNAARDVPIEDLVAVLRRYPRPIVHMRRQIQERRFGLVLGSGTSRDFGLPTWDDLIRRIAEHAEIQASDLLGRQAGKSQATRTQMLFEHFRRRVQMNQADEPSVLEPEIRRRWRAIVHGALYRDFDDSAGLAGRHPYLREYLELIRTSQLTVNYNFDDTIERMLDETRSEAEKEIGRGFETVWSATLQFRKSSGIIYHPNGYLPRRIEEGPSPEFVFSDDAFADQLIDIMGGHYATLLHHLSKNTCLLIGLSLEDVTLRHLLRQTARLYPGHYHYLVAHLEDDERLAGDEEAAVVSANFWVYNLITLFLTRSQSAALARLLQMGDRFRDLSEEHNVRRKFLYYITGIPGIGKTSCVLRCLSLVSYDEWFDPRLALLALDGRAVDEGGAFELGYAYAHGKLCYGLQTDPRRLIPSGNNPMIERALAHIFRDPRELVSWARQGAMIRIET